MAPTATRPSSITFGRREPPRVLRPPAHPLRVLPARRRCEDRQPRCARQGAGDAGPRAHRSRQHVRRRGVLPRSAQGGHQACSRLRGLFHAGLAPDARPEARHLPPASPGQGPAGLSEPHGHRLRRVGGGLLLQAAGRRGAPAPLQQGPHRLECLHVRHPEQVRRERRAGRGPPLGGDVLRDLRRGRLLRRVAAAGDNGRQRHDAGAAQPRAGRHRAREGAAPRRHERHPLRARRGRQDAGHAAVHLDGHGARRHAADALLVRPFLHAHRGGDGGGALGVS